MGRPDEIKGKKVAIPVEVRRSKTPFLKLFIIVCYSSVNKCVYTNDKNALINFKRRKEEERPFSELSAHGLFDLFQFLWAADILLNKNPNRGDGQGM